MAQQTEAPDNPYFRYLDRLSKLGVANMRAAGVFLEGRFLLEPDEAKAIVDAWLMTWLDLVVASVLLWCGIYVLAQTAVSALSG